MLSKALLGYYWLEKDLADQTKQKGVALGGTYIGSLGALGQATGRHWHGKGDQEIHKRLEVMEKPTPSTKERRNKRKATSPLRPRGEGKVPKTTTGVKRTLQGSSRKKASPKTPSPSSKSKKSQHPVLSGHYHRLNEAPNQHKKEPKTTRKAKRPLQGSSRKKASPKTPSPSSKSKKSRRPVLYGHYRRLHAALNQYEKKPEQDEGGVENPTTSNDYRVSWNLRGSPGTPQLPSKSPKSSR